MRPAPEPELFRGGAEVARQDEAQGTMAQDEALAVGREAEPVGTRALAVIEHGPESRVHRPQQVQGAEPEVHGVGCGNDRR